MNWKNYIIEFATPRRFLRYYILNGQTMSMVYNLGQNSNILNVI